MLRDTLIFLLLLLYLLSPLNIIETAGTNKRLVMNLLHLLCVNEK